MWCTLLIVGILVNIFVSIHLTVIAKTITKIVALLQLSVYLLTALRNPGIASKVIDEELPKHVNNPR